MKLVLTTIVESVARIEFVATRGLPSSGVTLGQERGLVLTFILSAIGSLTSPPGIIIYNWTIPCQNFYWCINCGKYHLDTMGSVYSQKVG